MKDCPRCGFMNPDKAEYCIRCRYSMSETKEGFKPLGGPEHGGTPSEAGESTPVSEKKEGPELIPPRPDLDDTFQGRGIFESGGYGEGGVSKRKAGGAAPGDAYAIMTGGEVLETNWIDGPTGKRRKEAKKRKPEPPRGTGKRSDRKLERDLKKSFPTAASAAHPAKRPSRISAPPQPHSGVPIVKRPVPGARSGRPRVGGRAWRPSVKKPSLPSMDFSFLSRITGKHVLTAVVAVLLLFAIIFALAGGTYFAKPEQSIVDDALSAMEELPGYHMDARSSGPSEEAGAITEEVQVDYTYEGDLRVTYNQASDRGTETAQVVRSQGSSFISEDGGQWEDVLVGYDSLDFSPGALFSGASGVQYIDQQPIDGIDCDHVRFAGGEDLVKSFFPKAEVGPLSRIDTEVWVDTDVHYIRHARIDCGNLYDKELGDFDCTVNVRYSDFGSVAEINPPFQ